MIIIDKWKLFWTKTKNIHAGFLKMLDLLRHFELLMRKKLSMHIQTQVTRIVNNQEDQTLVIKDYFQGNFVWQTIAIKIGPTLIFPLKTHWLNKL